MKRIINISATLFALFMLAFTAQCTSAQHTPPISTKYNNQEVGQILKSHKMQHSRDTYPDVEIVNKFTKDFPKTRDVEWERTEKLYEVDFEVGNRSYEACYDMGGELIMYKYDIKNSEVPAVIKSAALAQYPDFRIEDADKIVFGTLTIYKLELEKGRSQEVKIAIKSDGVILSDEYSSFYFY